MPIVFSTAYNFVKITGSAFKYAAYIQENDYKCENIKVLDASYSNCLYNAYKMSIYFNSAGLVWSKRPSGVSLTFYLDHWQFANSQELWCPLINNRCFLKGFSFSVAWKKFSTIVFCSGVNGLPRLMVYDIASSIQRLSKRDLTLFWWCNHFLRTWFLIRTFTKF